MSLALIAGFVAKYSNLPIAEKVAACASSLLMFIAYFMYIFFEISPSINNEVMHSISSNLLDWATSGLLLFVILTAYIYKGK